MRTWYLSEQAAAEYLKQPEAFGPAARLAERVEQFLASLCARPNRRRIPERDIWEAWIPDTKLVVWYRFTDVELEVVRFWHTSQNHQRTP